MKYLITGMLLSLLGILISILIWDIHMVSTVTAIIGFFFLFIALITSGAMVNRDRMRANFATESQEGRTQRQNISFYSFLLGLPSLVVALLFYNL